MQELITLMDKVKTSGAFSVSGTLPSILPGLHVKGVGNIGLPLTEHQAKALIELSEQAPFGRGEETIVDTDVRQCWQISAEDFELGNPQWNEALQAAADQIGKELGLSGCKIGFEPYKLLVYEEGSFFTTHRDTEKIPNMFATWVVNLPSEHEGGELMVSHAGQSQSYSFADSPLFETSFVAFYADCYHEVKPITAGYRLCLVYNLAITNRKKQPVLSQRMGPIEEIDHAIQAWRQEAHDNPILTYLLDHSYSEQNLSMANLKHGDFAKASVLLNAAVKSGCQAYLCLATYSRTSYGEVYGYGWRGRRGRYSDYDDDDLDESDFEEYDVSEERVYAHVFVAADGTKINVKQIDLEEDDLVAKVPLVDGPGRGYSISEATGNEGASKDLWYHRGAVIMWPKERELELVAKMDVDYGIHVLKSSIQDQNQLEGEYRQQLIRLANHIIETLPSYRNEDISAELIQLGDIELLKKSLFRQAHSYSIDIDPTIFIKVAEQFGWKHFAKDVELRLTARNGLQWLDSLVQTGQSISDEGQGLMRKWVTSRWQQSLTSAMQSVAEPALPSNARARDRYKYQVARFNTAKHAQQDEIIYMVRLTSCLNMETLASKVIERLADSAEEQFLTETYGPAIISALNTLKKEHNQTIAQQFAAAVRQCIQAEYPNPPEPPLDWSREGLLDCDCEFCTEVNEFLPKSDVSSIGIYKTLKRNLLHVESEAEKSQIEVDIDIEKVASKFNGIIRKNQNRYDRKRQLYDAAQGIIGKLPS